MTNLPEKILTAVVFILCFVSGFSQEKIVFSADKMRGSSSASGTTVLEGNAKVKAGSMEISGDIIEMNGKNSRFIVATGNVSGADETEGYFFTANKLKYDRELEYAVLEGSAVMEDTKNNVTAKGGIITYDKKNETAVMQINVRILKEEIACRASFAVYSRALDKLELTGAPTVVKGQDTFNASKITVDLKTEDIIMEGYVSGSVTEDKSSSTGDASRSNPDSSSPEPDLGDKMKPVAENPGSGEQAEEKSAGSGPVNDTEPEGGSGGSGSPEREGNDALGDLSGNGDSLPAVEDGR